MSNMMMERREERLDGGPPTNCDSSTFRIVTMRVHCHKPSSWIERLFGKKTQMHQCVKCGEYFNRKPQGLCNARHGE